MFREALLQIFSGSVITQIFAALVVTVVMVPMAQALPDYILCILLKIQYVAPHIYRGVAADGSI